LEHSLPLIAYLLPIYMEDLMTVRRLVAIGFIFVCVTVAWAILSVSINVRTHSGYESLGRQVEELWGAPHVQTAPVVYFLPPDGRTPEKYLELESSDIQVALKLKHRQKGLLWYSTYEIAFDGRYTVQNPSDEAEEMRVRFVFPSTSAIYDDFVFTVNGVTATPEQKSGEGIVATVELAPAEQADIHIAYKSRGLDRWLYSFGTGIVSVKNFTLMVDTDFKDINFPTRTISASTKTLTPQGWSLEWRFANLLSDFNVGVEMPRKLNPGPLASRMSSFAPVSLLFFFTVLVMLGAMNKVNLHPMHYFFLAAGFFAFHLLFAYLADHLPLQLTFIISAAVSLGLVVSYLWRVVSRRFALREAGISQFLFLVLFSYAFFFEGYSGLVVTVGAIITLAVLMQMTARVNWEEVFEKKAAP
jgi:hypothetical protein